MIVAVVFHEGFLMLLEEFFDFWIVLIGFVMFRVKDSGIILYLFEDLISFGLINVEFFLKIEGFLFRGHLLGYHIALLFNFLH